MADHSRRKTAEEEFEVSVDRGTFGDYEAFGVYNEDADPDDAPEYEIFIVSTGEQEVRSPSGEDPPGRRG